MLRARRPQRRSDERQGLAQRSAADNRRTRAAAAAAGSGRARRRCGPPPPRRRRTHRRARANPGRVASRRWRAGARQPGAAQPVCCARRTAARTRTRATRLLQRVEVLAHASDLRAHRLRALRRRDERAVLPHRKLLHLPPHAVAVRTQQLRLLRRRRRIGVGAGLRTSVGAAPADASADHAPCSSAPARRRAARWCSSRPPRRRAERPRPRLTTRARAASPPARSWLQPRRAAADAHLSAMSGLLNGGRGLSAMMGTTRSLGLPTWRGPAGRRDGPLTAALGARDVWPHADDVRLRRRAGRRLGGVAEPTWLEVLHAGLRVAGSAQARPGRAGRAPAERAAPRRRCGAHRGAQLPDRRRNACPGGWRLVLLKLRPRRRAQPPPRRATPWLAGACALRGGCAGCGGRR